jgi:diguanylate cyclase (GGDEF)-like protein
MLNAPPSDHAAGVGDVGRRLSALLLALALVAVVAGTAEYLVAISARVWLANAAWVISSLVAIVGVYACRRRSAPRDRAGWALLLWGCGAWLVGELFWIAYGLVGYPSSPNAADLSWLAFAIFAVLGVLRLGAVARGRPVPWLELAPLVIAVCALLSALLWSDLRSSALSGTAELTTLAYPALYVTSALVMLQSVVTGTLDLRGNVGMALVVVGLVVEALAFVLWTPLLLSASYVPGTNAVDALWTSGMLFVGLGAALARPPRAVADVERVSRRRGAVLPSVTFATVAVVQAALILAHAPAGAEFALCVGVLLTGATLSARSTWLHREQAALYERLQDREAELREVNGRLSHESRRDPLTGLFNRLRLDEDLAELAGQFERHGRSYTLVLCDLDRFKSYNDALGHQAGDGALRRVATVLDGETRAGDRVYRYGGEELLLVLTDQDANAGAAVAERRRIALEQAGLHHPLNAPTGVLTFSAGVAAAQPGETPAEVLRRADEALYRAKSSGRNQIAVAAYKPLQQAVADTVP